MIGFPDVRSGKLCVSVGVNEHSSPLEKSLLSLPAIACFNKSTRNAHVFLQWSRLFLAFYFSNRVAPHA